jgi:hypothetical protein
VLFSAIPFEDRLEDRPLDAAFCVPRVDLLLEAAVCFCCEVPVSVFVDWAEVLRRCDAQYEATEAGWLVTNH